MTATKLSALADCTARTWLREDRVISPTLHALPASDAESETADPPLLRDDYDAFLAWRQERLWQEIQRVTGVMVAGDLEAGEDGEGSGL